MKKKTKGKKRKASIVQRIFKNKKLSIMMIFVLLFAGIGSYVLITSHAAYPFFGIEQDQYNKINAYRASKGVGGLASEQCLSEQARDMAQKKANAGDLVHSDLFNQYGKCGGSALGENLGRSNYPNDSDSANSIWAGFLNSPLHEQNIRDGRWRFMGVGVAKSANGTLYIAQAFANACSSGCGPAVNPVQIDPQYYISLAVKPGATSGYAIDNYGDTTGFGGKQNLATPGYWPFQNVVRSATVNSVGQGYKLDKFGALWPFPAYATTAATPAATGGPYWNGWDIARDVKLIGSSTKGYVLDGLGGIHAFNGASGSISAEGYWNWNAARRFAINKAGTQGYVMDVFGGLHPFSRSGYAWLPKPTNAPYWSGQSNIAQTVVLRNDGNTTYDGKQGYTLDYAGGIHSFNTGGVCKPPAITTPYYSLQIPVATDLVITKWGTCTTPSKGFLLLVNGTVKGF